MNIPAGFSTVTPYIIVNQGESMLRFLREGLNAKICLCHRDGGRIIHAQLRIGDSMVMLSEVDENENGRPAAFYVFVDDADLAQAQALSAGATQNSPVADMPYGDRHGEVIDPCGNTWWLAQRLTDRPYE